MSMSSSRPYMVRAIYEWILDNDCTPYILVNAMDGGVEVPQEYVQDGQIVLNISPTAVSQLHIGNDTIHFSGRFGGIARTIMSPMSAVMGIYARENGQGMLFEPELPGSSPPPATPPVDSKKSDDKGRSKPSLKVIK